jgi:hypothetical protein
MAQLAVEMTGDEKRLERSIAQLTAKVVTLEQKLAQAGKTGKKAGADINKTMKGARSQFGAQAVGDLKKYAAGWIGVSSAVASVKQVLNEVSAAHDEASRKLTSAEQGMASLSQLALGDQQKLTMLINQARELRKSGGAGSMDEAARIVFALESAGSMSDIGLFKNLYGVVGSPDVFARATTTLQTAMGKGETGSIRNIASKAFAASQFAPASAEQLLEAATKGAANAKMLGWSDEELLAATALMAKATGSAEEGATTIASLGRALVKQDGFKGLTIQQAVQQLSGMGMTDAEMQKYLGRAEAVRAFSVLRDQGGQLGMMTSEIAGAQQGDLVGDIIRSRFSQPELFAAWKLRQSEGAREVAEIMNSGVARTLTDAQINFAKASMEAEGGWAPAMRTFGMKTQRFVLGDDWYMGLRGAIGDDNVVSVEDYEYLRDQARTGGTLGLNNANELGYRPDAEAMEAMRSAAARINDASEKLESASRNLGGDPAMRRPGEDR